MHLVDEFKTRYIVKVDADSPVPDQTDDAGPLVG
jgi:hypothetical protein